MLLFFCALTLQFGFKNTEEPFHAVSSEVPSFLDSCTLTAVRGSGFFCSVLSCSPSAPEALVWPSSAVLVLSHEWQHEHLLLLSHPPELCLLQGHSLAAPGSPSVAAGASSCSSLLFPRFPVPTAGPCSDGIQGNPILRETLVHHWKSFFVRAGRNVWLPCQGCGSVTQLLFCGTNQCVPCRDGVREVLQLPSPVPRHS